MRISLRGRLTFWYVLAIPILIFALVFTALRVMVTNLENDLEDDLRDRAEMVATAMRSSPSSDRQNYQEILSQLTEQQLPSIPLLIRISDPFGRVIATFGDIPAPIIPSLDRQLSLSNAGQGRFRNVKIKGVEALRVYTAPVYIPVDDSDTLEPLGLVQTGESLSQVKTAQGVLLRDTLIEGIVGSLLTVAVGMFILYRGFRPLDRILRRVRDIRTDNLGAGVPDEPRPPELQQLANSLNVMCQRLDLAFRERQTFVASVSHDLRTPLTALQGQIEVLLMQSSLNGETQDSLERMSKEVRRLVRMTNNLLLNAQLEARPTLAPEQVNLRELLEDVVAAVWVLAEHLELTLATSEDLVITGDHDLLKQMVLNIVDNAIKFTPEGGRVALSLLRQGEQAVLVVSDTGRGIPAAHLPKVMDPFYKVDGARGPLGSGAGLGLAIVNQIVDLHGGEIEIKSQEKVGTVVRIKLPLVLVAASSNVSGRAFLEAVPG